MPFPSADQHPLVVIAASHRRRHTKRVLLVDNDPVVLQLFTAVLTDAGYKVAACGGCVEAIESFRTKRRYDLLLTDFEMPTMNGLTLANLLTGVARKLPVLIVSGAAPGEIPLMELWRKKWCFLAKPVRAPLLLKTIDHLCGLMPIHVVEADILGSQATPYER